MFLILTEDTNRPLVKKTLLTQLKGFTILPGEGVWESENGTVAGEDSLAILVYNASLDNEIKPVCRELCRVNNQERIDILNLKNGQVHQVGKV